MYVNRVLNATLMNVNVSLSIVIQPSVDVILLPALELSKVVNAMMIAAQVNAPALGKPSCVDQTSALIVLTLSVNV